MRRYQHEQQHSRNKRQDENVQRRKIIFSSNHSLNHFFFHIFFCVKLLHRMKYAHKMLEKKVSHQIGNEKRWKCCETKACWSVNSRFYELKWIVVSVECRSSWKPIENVYLKFNDFFHVWIIIETKIKKIWCDWRQTIRKL